MIEFYDDVKSQIYRLTGMIKDFDNHTDDFDRVMTAMLVEDIEKSIETLNTIYFNLGKREAPDELITKRDELLAEINVMLANAEHNQSEDVKPYEYKGIAEALSKYITGATDEVIEHIAKHKSLPDGAAKPTWVGRPADAHRFRLWCDTTEQPMISCFNQLTVDNFKRSGAQNSFIYMRKGSVWDVLKNYPKP